MEVAYYNLAGGINQALTKTELGIDTKKVCWSDAENVEILQNRGIVKQKGNSLFLEIGEEITGLAEISAYDVSKMLITTVSGKIYIYDENHSKKTLVDKTLKGVKPVFLNFLNGILVMTEADGLFYIKNNADYEVVECNLKDLSKNTVTGASMAIYKGRVWVAKDAAISAVNQASVLQDGQQLYIVTVEEQKTKQLSSSEGSLETSGEGRVADAGKVNINQASEEELMTLPGIGASKAADIVRYREEQGRFEQIEDIMNISGIKEAVFGKIKDKITVQQ